MPTKKTAAKKAPLKKSPASAPSSAPWRVRVRMYRKWLGDCFLLSFRDGSLLSHVLIDCGALLGTADAKAVLTAAVDDIRNLTGGKLAALAVTHEHWDHVSGFYDAFASFQNFTAIGEVWAAWTEDPQQTIAQEKKKQNRLQANAIQAALHQWSHSVSDDDQRKGAALAALAAFSVKSDEAMRNAMSLAKPRWLSPGQSIQCALLPGVRVHVLGPPRDLLQLHDVEGVAGKDEYAADAARTASLQAFAAAAARKPSDPDPYQPFESFLQWDEPAWAAQWPDLATLQHSDNRRAINGDWLNNAAQLALQLDNAINNTSLVLAFELIESRQVLLFVGDAQFGNWNSWTSIQFDDPAITASDLLSRTVLYKVGHHGSINGTRKQNGLEAMTSPDLVAMIPIDEQMARRPKGSNPQGWDMPAAPLLAALQAKTAGRVLRADSNFPLGAAPPPNLSPKAWQDFQHNTSIQEHYIDYFLGG